MKGVVDGISRTKDNVMAIGWLADPAGDGTSLTILVFVGGKNVAATQTRGERPDVTKALGLASGAAQNVAFEASFSCRSGDRPIIVGLGPNKEYYNFPLSSPQCP
jgi:hypothetical protein